VNGLKSGSIDLSDLNWKGWKWWTMCDSHNEGREVEYGRKGCQMSICGFNFRDIVGGWYACILVWFIDNWTNKGVLFGGKKGEVTSKANKTMIQYGWSQSCCNWSIKWHGLNWIKHQNYQAKHLTIKGEGKFMDFGSNLLF
jgi:hypothetical protein